MFSDSLLMLSVPGTGMDPQEYAESTLKEVRSSYAESTQRMAFLSAEHAQNDIVLMHNWASASRLMPPASALRHPTSQSGTGTFWHRTRPDISKPDWLRHRLSFSYRYRNDRMPDSIPCRLCTVHPHTAADGVKLAL
jgi:hypothetical protein